MAGLAPLVGEMLGVERAPIEVVDDGLRHSVRIGDAIDFEIEDIVPVRRRDRRAGPASTACSTRSARTSRWPRRSARGSTPSASSTRARPGCRRPSSPGPPERVIASARRAAPGAAAVSRPALRRRPGPARARRPALRARRRRLVVDGRPDARDGRRALDGSRHARLVPRRLGRDDGGDDVPVGRADGRAVLAHDAGAIAARAAALHRRLSRHVGGRRSARLRASRSPADALAGDVLAWDRAGRWVAGATLSSPRVYELTPLKDVCLGKCRSPLGFLLGSWRDGRSARCGWARSTAPGASAAAGR